MRQKRAAEQLDAQKYGREQRIGCRAEHGGIPETGGKDGRQTERFPEHESQTGSRREECRYFPAQKPDGKRHGRKQYLDDKIKGIDLSARDGDLDEIRAQPRVSAAGKV